MAAYVWYLGVSGHDILPLYSRATRRTSQLIPSYPGVSLVIFYGRRQPEKAPPESTCDQSAVGRHTNKVASDPVVKSSSGQVVHIHKVIRGVHQFISPYSSVINLIASSSSSVHPNGASNVSNSIDRLFIILMFVRQGCAIKQCIRSVVPSTAV